MWLFRTYCFKCGNLSFGKLICEECQCKVIPFSYLKKSRCEKCSKPLEEYEETLCENCIDKYLYFEKNISLYPYNDLCIRELVRLFKFEVIGQAGETIADIIRDEVFNCINNLPVDLITCVPVSRESLKERGFNPVAFILDKLKIRYKNILGRKSHLKKQSELSNEEREKYVKGQFYLIDGIKLKGERIVVIDDIFTSGNTLNEVAKVLIEGGAGVVNTLTFFRD